MKYRQAMGEKREIICLTKIDAISNDEVLKFQQYFEKQLDKKVLAISAVSGKNIDKLKTVMSSSIFRDRSESSILLQ